MENEINFNLGFDLDGNDDEFELECRNLMCGELLVEPFQVIASHSYMRATDADAGESFTVQSKMSESTETAETTRQKTIRKPHTVKLVWSHKNKKRGKSYREYMERQILIARKICKYYISLINTHHVQNFSEFASVNFSPKFSYREYTEGVHPFTGTEGVDRKIEGVQNFIDFISSYFEGVPDGALLVNGIEILDEGKTVAMNTTIVGTPLQNIQFPGKIKGLNSGETGKAVLMEPFTKCGVMQFLLDKDNKLLKIEFVC